MSKKEIRNIIRQRIDKAMECGFKRAWIPVGWAVIKVDVFIKELANELAEQERKSK